MKRLFLLLALLLTLPVASANADSVDISGQWHGTWELNELTGYSSNFSVIFYDDPTHGLLAISYVPELEMFDEPLPAALAGEVVTIGVPGLVLMSGTLNGDVISGTFYSNVGDPITGTIFLQKFPVIGIYPGDAPGPECDVLPPPFCVGSVEYCGEVVLFDPAVGYGYSDDPSWPEDEVNQYFSYLRRDLMKLIKYATAKVACKTAGWGYGNFAPLHLSDMSEADGSTPGTNYGPGLRHPSGTHEDGLDIDLGYYQLYAADNLFRPVCLHFDEYTDALHCVGEPYALDPWRNALFVAYLSEHPRLRVVGVDAKIAPVLNNALDSLVGLGWIDAALRDSVALAYEEVGTGQYWELTHHHHMHASMGWLNDIVEDMKVWPGLLFRRSVMKNVFVTIEITNLSEYGIDANDIDPLSVHLIAGGDTLIYAKPGFAPVTDLDWDGLQEITLAFDQQELMGALENGKQEIAVSGLIAEYYFFQGSDSVRVLGW